MPRRDAGERRYHSICAMGNAVSQSPTRRALREHAVGLIAVVIVAGGIYVNSLRAPFVWDDNWVLVSNEGVSDPRNIPEFFAPRYWQQYYAEFFRGMPGRGYRPVPEITFAIDHAIWGLNPFGFRLGNVFWHIANSVLAYFLTYRVFGHRRPAIFAALLFAAHPLHTEAVVWVKVRSQLMAVSFMLVSALTYARYADSPGGRRRALCHVASVASFGLAILCKKTAVLLPAILVLYVWCFVPRRRWGAALLGLLPFVAAVMGMFALEPLIPDMPRNRVAPGTYLLSIFVALGEYLRLFAAPVNLCLHHHWHRSLTHLYPQVWRAAPFVLALVVGAVIALRRSRRTFFALGWFLIALVPSLRIGFMGREIAESRIYGPSIGLCMVAGFLLHRLGDVCARRISLRRWTWLPVGICVLVVAVCSGLTIARNIDWSDTFTLWLDTVKKNPASWHAQIRVAKGYAARDRPDKAIEHLEAAFEVHPQDMKALMQLGNLCERLGREDEAMRHYRALLKLDTQNVTARVRLGVLFAKRGESEKAIGYLLAASSIDPRSANAPFNLGVLYANNRDYKNAIGAFERAVRLGPDDAGIRASLAAAYVANGEQEKAIVELEQAIVLRPTDPMLHEALAAAYTEQESFHQAAAEYQRCVDIDPGNADAWLYLGKCHERLNNEAEAIRSYRQCARLGGPAGAEAKERLEALGALAPR